MRLPDNASLFHVHEIVPATRASFAITTNAEGFTIGASYDPNSLRVEWVNLEAMSAFPTASRCRVAYRHVGGITCRDYRLRSRKGLKYFQSQTEMLFAHVEEHRPLRAFRGWLDVPSIGWVETPSWPTESATKVADYRQNARSEQMLCEAKDESTSFDRLLLFMRTASLNYRQVLGDVALSENRLYKRSGDCILSVPRHTLRLRRQSFEPRNKMFVQTYYRTAHEVWCESGDGELTVASTLSDGPPSEPNIAVYTFGRDLDVFLQSPDTNPVALELDKQLFGTRDAPSTEEA